MNKKYDYYYTTKKTKDGFVWFIRNKEGKVLETSDETFPTKRDAELDCLEFIFDEYDY